MKISWSEPAIADLDNIKNYIARDSDLYASRMIEGIILSVERLLKFPEMGRKVPEADSDAIREILFRNYRIIYRTTDLTIRALSLVRVKFPVLRKNLGKLRSPHHKRFLDFPHCPRKKVTH